MSSFSLADSVLCSPGCWSANRNRIFFPLLFFVAFWSFSQRSPRWDFARWKGQWWNSLSQSHQEFNILIAHSAVSGACVLRKTCEIWSGYIWKVRLIFLRHRKRHGMFVLWHSWMSIWGVFADLSGYIWYRVGTGKRGCETYFPFLLFNAPVFLPSALYQEHKLMCPCQESVDKGWVLKMTDLRGPGNGLC